MLKKRKIWIHLSKRSQKLQTSAKISMCCKSKRRQKLQNRGGNLDAPRVEKTRVKFGHAACWKMAGFDMMKLKWAMKLHAKEGNWYYRSTVKNRRAARPNFTLVFLSQFPWNFPFRRAARPVFRQQSWVQIQLFASNFIIFFYVVLLVIFCFQLKYKHFPTSF